MTHKMRHLKSFDMATRQRVIDIKKFLMEKHYEVNHDGRFDHIRLRVVRHHGNWSGPGPYKPNVTEIEKLLREKMGLRYDAWVVNGVMALESTVPPNDLLKTAKLALEQPNKKIKDAGKYYQYLPWYKGKTFEDIEREIFAKYSYVVLRFYEEGKWKPASISD